MLIKLITNSIDEQETYRCVLIMNSDSSASLNFTEQLEYKQLSLLCLKLRLGDTDEINKHVSYKYRLAQHQLTANQSKLEEVCSILKLKNPSLIS